MSLMFRGTLPAFLHPDVRLDVFADQMQYQPGVHDREWNVGLALIDVKVAPGYFERLMAGLLIEVNPDHADSTPDQLQVKLKTLDQPVGSVPRYFDVKGELRITTKFHVFAYQFLKTFSLGNELRPFIGSLEFPAVGMFCQVPPKLPEQ